MLTNESIFLINSLTEQNGKSVKELARRYQISQKKLWYEIDQINIELAFLQLPKIQLETGRLAISNQLKEGWKAERERLKRRDIQFQEERIYLIILYTFIAQEAISNSHYQDLLQVSKNSVLLDLKKVKRLCSSYHLEFSYSRKMGYHFIGSEQNIRKLAEYAISKLLALSIGEWTLTLIFQLWQIIPSQHEISQELLALSKKYQVTFVQERLTEFIWLLCLLKVRKQRKVILFHAKELVFIKKQPLHNLGQEVAKQLLDSDLEMEGAFVTTRLLSALQGTKQFHQDKKFKELTTAIIERVQVLTGTIYPDKNSLSRSLFEHLVPAYFRIFFEIPLENPYGSQIKRDYSELYYLVEKGLKPLAESLGKAIPSHEIAYFTIHFGGQLPAIKRLVPSLRALTICPNGISSSLMMNAQLKELFPQIKFHPVHSLDQAKLIPEIEYDLVFATTYFPTTKKVYLAKPMLNPVEKEMLKRTVLDDFENQTGPQAVDVAALMKIVKKHTEIKNEKALYESLSSALYGIDSEQPQGGRTLTELLEKRFIQFSDASLDWQSAIALATEPLLKANFVTEAYVAAMIENVKEMGAYIVLAPKVAVPHARPEDGVQQLGISLLHLSQPVNFNLTQEYDEEREVQLIFVLAAIDNVGHLTALKQLSQILEDDEKISALIATKDQDQLYQKLKDEGTSN